MSERQPASKNLLFLFGRVVVTAAGLYYTLVSVGLIPIPGKPGSLYAPLWVLACLGISYIATGDLAASAPRWMRVVQFVLALAIFCGFGAIASWVAFGSAPRNLTAAAVELEELFNSTFGRVVFGIGAVIIWFCTIVYAVTGARKLFGWGASQRS